MRNSYNEKLAKLNEGLGKMCHLCEASLGSALNILLNQDESLLNSHCGEILELKNKLEDQCINLLLEENPVASDFRVIIATLLMMADLNRIGSQSARIAHLARLFHQKGLTLEVPSLEELGRITITMVHNSIESVIANNADLAAVVVDGDVAVDDAFNKVKQQLAKLMVKQPESGDLLIDLILVAKYYERIGDHSVNVARQVQYRLNGKEA